MEYDRAAPRDAADLTRRAWLVCGAASAAALAPAGWAAEQQPAKAAFQAFDKIEPQKYAWGWIRWLMNAELEPGAQMTLGIVQIEPRQSNPLHVHPNCEELLHVLSGSCEHRLGDQWLTLKAGDTVRVPQNARHMARTKDEACRLLVVYNTGARQMTPVDES